MPLPASLSSVQSTEPTIPDTLPTDQATGQTCYPELRPAIELEDGSLYMQKVCKASCIQSSTGECTGKLTSKANEEHCWLKAPTFIRQLDQSDKKNTYVADILEPLFELARAKFHNESIDPSIQSQGDNCFRQLVQSVHHTKCYWATLKDGARSRTIAEWIPKLQTLYREMVDTATAHGSQADKSRATFLQLEQQADLQLKSRNDFVAAREKLGEDNDYRELLKLADRGVDEAEKKVHDHIAEADQETERFERGRLGDFGLHWSRLSRAYAEKTPRDPERRLLCPRQDGALTAKEWAESIAEAQTAEEVIVDHPEAVSNSPMEYGSGDEKQFTSTKHLYDNQGKKKQSSR